MNEYQDQGIWFEVCEQVAYRRFELVSYHDTREEANLAKARLEAAAPDRMFKVQRRGGLA